MNPADKEYVLKNYSSQSCAAMARKLGLKEKNIRKFLEKQKNRKVLEDGQKRTLTPSAKSNLWISVALIVTLGFTVYANSINGKFIWDDEFLVQKNAFITSFAHLPDIFIKNSTKETRREFGFYRPFQEFTYLVDHSVWKLNAKGYHVTNILIHILVALAVLWFIHILFDDWLLARLTALFYIVHPLHTEAITYIAGRADPLAALFMLLCFIFYIKFHAAPKTGTFVIMILSYICAVLSRESALILPALIMLYHFSFKKKCDLKAFVPVLIITGVYMIIRFTALKFLLADSYYTTTLWQRLPGLFIALSHYARLLLFPVNLHMGYGNAVYPVADWRVLTGVTLLCVSIFYAFHQRKNNTLVSFGLLWFFVALFPHTNIYPINAFMAEHWLYVPSIGLFVIFASILTYLYRKINAHILLHFFIIGALSYFSILTIQQNSYWNDPLAFYEKTLEYSPDDPKVNNNVGLIYNTMGEKQKAIGFLENAIKSDPDYYEAYNNLGNIYKDTGRYEEAIVLFKKAIEMDPGYTEAYNNLGVAFMKIGNKKDAVTMMEKALKLKPNFLEAYNNLSALYFYSKDYKSALYYYDKAKTLGFDNPTLSTMLEPYRTNY